MKKIIFLCVSIIGLLNGIILADNEPFLTYNILIQNKYKAPITYKTPAHCDTPAYEKTLENDDIDLFGVATYTPQNGLIIKDKFTNTIKGLCVKGYGNFYNLNSTFHLWEQQIIYAITASGKPIKGMFINIAPTSYLSKNWDIELYILQD